MVGQEKMKKALLLNAVNPRIGGVLIRGQKGTGKSTAVRALAELLPEIKVVKDCPFNCNPDNPREMCDSCYERYMKGEDLPWIKRKVRIINLPLNATVDRVAGTLSIEKALKKGEKALDPGLLAEANRGILYIDEVNLLDDYVADILLDAAASGVNVVERENISVTHPSRFILIGTMNPEEGELRPQLLDRFGLQVEVEPITDPKLQVEIVKRVEEFETDPERFIEKYEKRQRELKERILTAQRLLSTVQISDGLLHEVANICSKLAVSNRAPIVIARTAKTMAAFSGRTEVDRKDLVEAMELALPHRMRKRPFEKPILPKEKIEEMLMRDNEIAKKKIDGDRNERKSAILDEKIFDIGSPYQVDLDAKAEKPFTSGKSGRRITLKSHAKRGAYIYSILPRSKPKDIAIDATIRAASLHSNKEKTKDGMAIEIKDEDIREKVRRLKTSTLITLVVDASGSMAALKRMEAAKGAALALLKDAYIRRDKVAFIAFRGENSELLMPPTNNIDLAEEALAKLPTGGRTPLSHALLSALSLVRFEKMKNTTLKPLIILISDGKANVSLGGSIREEIVEICRNIKRAGAELTIINMSNDIYAPNYIKDMIEAAEAKCYRINELTSRNIQETIKESLLGLT